MEVVLFIVAGIGVILLGAYLIDRRGRGHSTRSDISADMQTPERNNAPMTLSRNLPGTDEPRR